MAAKFTCAGSLWLWACMEKMTDVKCKFELVKQMQVKRRVQIKSIMNFSQFHELGNYYNVIFERHSAGSIHRSFFLVLYPQSFRLPTNTYFSTPSQAIHPFTYLLSLSASHSTFFLFVISVKKISKLG